VRVDVVAVVRPATLMRSALSGRTGRITPVGRSGVEYGGMTDAGVSEREAQVLAAVGEHLTNAEIAARLVISIRTVESHVSSLLRKLGAADRRALAALAADEVGAGARPARVGAALPSALTPFVGRSTERAELGELLSGPARLVTAVGPGGVGKTRLALAVAADVADRFADGVWYVDLVPVADPAMIAPAVAGALGLGEQPGRAAEDTLLGWATDRTAVLVLDNCEHLLDGVAQLTERLLAQGGALVVLTTSRARLMLPFERVFPVEGLAADGAGDAIALFTERAAAAGAVVTADDRVRVARICRGLDGVPLAIELAAARLPAVGLDGLEAGLADRLRLLTGARRADGRHRSLRSTLDWSCALLDDTARAVLRRGSVFAGAFSAADATDVVGWAPVRPRDVAAQLAELAEHSLLVPVPAADGTRYRQLETVRQYGAELLEDTGELDEAHLRLLRWAGAAGCALRERTDDGAAWRSAFDRVADELRAALAWAAERPEHRGPAHEAASLLAELCLRRGLPGESQRRSEQAAELAADDLEAAVALRRAAGAATARLAGDQAVRLHGEAASAAERGGTPAAAAADLAQLAELLNRGPGIIARPPDPVAVRTALDGARRLAGADPLALARIAVAEAFAVPETGADGAAATERALRLARALGDPLIEIAALDRQTTVWLSRGDPRAALATAQRRIELLAPLPVIAEHGFELSDVHVMAVESAIGAGDLPAALRYAETVRDLPPLREIGHVAVARLIVVTFLTGDWATTLTAADRFLESWERAGRPRVPTLRRAAHAVTTLHGLRGDTAARRRWEAVFEVLALPGPPGHDERPTAVFDALLLLHQDRPDAAMRRLPVPPAELVRWYEGLWRPWYAALWAEAAVLAGVGDAAERVAAAGESTAGNPIAEAVVERAGALLAGDAAAVAATADRLRAAGCRYQAARSLLLTGGEAATRGRAELVEMGAPPP
jgi:predicted ATPase/DNA-binding CsgD family transcriptional regulator